MPATYAPGPRCNDVDYTTGFWACQGLNTTYLASSGADPLHVGGLPVDIPEDELGTGGLQPGGEVAQADLLGRVERCEVDGLCAKLRSTGGTHDLTAPCTSGGTARHRRPLEN